MGSGSFPTIECMNIHLQNSVVNGLFSCTNRSRIRKMYMKNLSLMAGSCKINMTDSPGCGSYDLLMNNYA